jgi:hypothetical protein
MGSGAKLVQKLRDAAKPNSSAASKQPDKKRGTETTRTTSDEASKGFSIENE